MSLKVLLADESSTIKKVFQLALQDYAVEVTAVHSGDDVVPVAKNSNPDIIFIDILLQKKSGYDVACEIKEMPQFANTHVVLMWSSFLTLDQDKFQASLATSHIEKPFEIENLRSLIQQLVPKTQSQKLSQFLQMPDTPLQEQKKETPPKTAPAPPNTPNDPSASLAPEEFEEVHLDVQLKTDSLKELQDIQNNNDILEEDETAPAWVSRSLSDSGKTDNFLSPDLDVPDDELPFDEIKTKIDTVVSEQLLETKNYEMQTPSIELAEVTETAIEAIPVDEEEKKSIYPERRASPNYSLTPEQIQAIVREEAKAIIEEAVWKIVPEVATQMIEKEIKRLIQSNKPGAI